MGMIGQLGGQELNFQMFRNTSDAQDDGDDNCQDSDEDIEELAEGISVEQFGDGCAEENSGWTEKSFAKVLELLGRAFGEQSSWPKSSYEAKKIIKTLGLNYEKIHVCKQDCMLFWREYASAESCHICGTSRWVDSTKKRAVKVLRWLPEGHLFRYQKQLFDGTEEARLPPKRASGSDVLNQLDGLQFTFGKFKKKKVVKDIKVPDGYASNISRCVNLQERKIGGLKSHDCHVLVQDILPLALRACNPPKEVIQVVSELATIFKSLCSKVVDVNELEELQNQIVMTICQMEKIFLPSFFTIMVHLIIHLVEEMKLGGPINFRWMYPFERFFMRFKSYVKNRTHPEGSIAEGYIAEECLTFCSRYLQGVETKFNRPMRNPNPPTNDQVKYLFSSVGQHIGKIEEIVLDEISLVQAHRYVLRHCDDIENFRREFIELEKRKRRRHSRLSEVELEKLVNENFHLWFRSKVFGKRLSGYSVRVVALGVGP
ncbi:uncharacterized protein LOC120262183 [Dioscorea cayenensis subsp. rotundata]|uniref:Uncharacterized protein LOC120262183 n=1 Tax=Dioscorea cayennensis subsp. rotundata TaxID=55577 RepID=A0AB40BGV2_DIOCR|nr:uncharacterized protein LOC120262183 [Dioscorea cayenensis subsp. rotundata]